VRNRLNLCAALPAPSRRYSRLPVCAAPPSDAAATPWALSDEPSEHGDGTCLYL